MASNDEIRNMDLYIFLKNRGKTPVSKTNGSIKNGINRIISLHKKFTERNGK